MCQLWISENFIESVFFFGKWLKCNKNLISLKFRNLIYKVNAHGQWMSTTKTWFLHYAYRRKEKIGNLKLNWCCSAKLSAASCIKVRTQKRFAVWNWISVWLAAATAAAPPTASSSMNSKETRIKRLFCWSHFYHSLNIELSVHINLIVLVY